MQDMLKTRYRQRSDLEGPAKKEGGPENLVTRPVNFIVPPPFNFYFSPCYLSFEGHNILQRQISQKWYKI